MTQDLNVLQIRTDYSPETGRQRDFGVAENDIECVFKNHTDRLIQEIQRHDVVFGCVAWVTNHRILRALAEKRGVALIVQKEDFLRPDVGGPDKNELRALYRSLPTLERPEFSGVLGKMSSCGDPDIGVRCCGFKANKKATARCHHKFVIFGKKIPNQKRGYGTIQADAVWTGSFNFTYNSERSFENAVIIRRPAIVQAFVSEFEQIAALSEPLDWSSDYVEPEWRFGT